MLMQIQLKPHPFLYVEMAFLSKTEMYIFFYYVFFFNHVTHSTKNMIFVLQSSKRLLSGTRF